MAEVYYQTEEQEQQYFFGQLAIIVLHADEVVVYYILQRDRKSQQKLKTVLLFAPILSSLMLVPLLRVFVSLIFQEQLINDHREGDGEEADEKGVGEDLIFVDSGALSAVVDEFVVGFGEGDDEGVEGEKDGSRGEEEVRIFGPVVAGVREEKIEGEGDSKASQLKQKHSLIQSLQTIRQHQESNTSYNSTALFDPSKLLCRFQNTCFAKTQFKRLG